MGKYILTGGPCSGKSTLIRLLKKKGFNVLEEIAREVLEERKYFSISREENRIRQNLIFYRQIYQEFGWQKNSLEGDVLFLDRGFPDVLGYTRHLLGRDWVYELPEDLINYSKVFLLDLLPFKNDGVRYEKEKEAPLIHSEISKAYKDLGYDLIKVPEMPILKRLDFILEHSGLK